MDNLNVQMYKDGSDLIVVFKGIDKSLETLIASMLSNVSVKKVPSIDEPVKVECEKPNTAELEEIPEFLADYSETVTDNDEEVIEDVIEEVIAAKEETETTNPEVPVSENADVITDPTTIENLVEYISLYVKVKQNRVNDMNTCNVLLNDYKKLHPADFGKMCCSTLTKEELAQILTELYTVMPTAIDAKTKIPLVNYLKTASENAMRYVVKGILWYNMK